MKPIATLKKEFKNLVPVGIDVVLKTIKQEIPVHSPKYNAVIELDARYRENHERQIRGTISDEDAEVERNRIREAILEFIDALEANDFAGVPDKPKPKSHRKGKIFYRIPDVMQTNVEATCLVRIAFNEATLTYDISVQAGDDIRELRRVSEVMGVELIDPSESKPFHIRRISEAVQFVEETDYTEWQFFVKPLLEGEFPLLLKVSVIEIKQGKERKKDIVLEERVQIVAKMPEQASEPGNFKEAAEVFQRADAAPIALGGAKSGADVLGSVDGVANQSPMPAPVEAPSPPKQKNNARNVFMKMATVAGLVLLVGSFWMLSVNKETSPITVQNDNPSHHFSNQSGTFQDARDGQEYRWVRLADGKKWMAENLNYATENSWCYNDDPENCKKYGRLYTWAEAMKVCPEGWRLPNAAELKNMAKKYGGYYDMMTSRMIGREMLSYEVLVKENSSGFTGMLGGFRDTSGSSYNLEEEGFYWTKTETGNNYAGHLYLGRVNGNFRYADNDKGKAFSCRCIKN